MPDVPVRQRLDMAVVAAGLAPSRSRARDLIKRGFVTADGIAVAKPSLPIAGDCVLALTPDAPDFVSRGAEKLTAGLSHFGFEMSGRSVLDIGASTGGFTEVALRGGARRVYAVDVGTDQLRPELVGHPDVVALEQTDARTLTRTRVPEAIDAIVCDVSFISATKVLSAALALAAPENVWLLVLIKPQFEAGPGAVNKAGVVVDDAARDAAVAAVTAWVDAQTGWRTRGVITSPIAGGDGNQEFLLGACRDGR